ncbi:RNase H family protein [Terrisporobacter sp.]|uniref:RNase H family protein n=1 Tax=Terrisporobacter sp. TaxID=1965305 RepID=UPI003FCE05C2
MLQNNKIIKKLYQGYKHTTNNRMEIRGVLETLKFFKTPVKIKIYSDSQYVINSIVNKHVYK